MEKHEAAFEALESKCAISEFSERYELGKRLGDGAQGSISMATEKKSGRSVVVKKLYQVPGPVYLNVLQNLSHPNVVRVFEIFISPIDRYVVQELCRGGDLFHVMAYCKREFNGMTHKFIASCMQQTMKGIDYLHSEFKASHNDIKPENILLERQPTSPNDFPRCVVADFASMGTDSGDWRYVAPELWPPTCGLRSYASDVWALGVMFFEMLSGGYLPFVDSPNVFGWVAFASSNDGRSFRQLQEGIVRKDTSGCIVGVEPHWHRIEENPSNDAKSHVQLVKSMLQREKYDRIPLRDAIKHPWFAYIFGDNAYTLHWDGDTIIVTNMEGQEVSSFTGFKNGMSCGELRSILQRPPLCDDMHLVEEFATKSGRSIEVDESIGEAEQVFVTVREKFGVSRNGGVLDSEKPKLHSVPFSMRTEAETAIIDGYASGYPPPVYAPSNDDGYNLPADAGYNLPAASGTGYNLSVESSYHLPGYNLPLAAPPGLTAEEKDRYLSKLSGIGIFAVKMFRSFPESARNDREIQLHAVEEAEDSLQFSVVADLFGIFPEDARSNEEIQARSIARCSPPMFHCLCAFLPEDVMGNPEIKTMIVQKIESWEGEEFKFCMLPAYIKQSREMLEKAIETFATTEIPRLFSSLDKDYRTDPALRDEAFEKCPAKKIPELFSALVVDDRKDPAVREKAFEKCSTTKIPQLFSALVVDDRKDPAVREKAFEKCSTTEIPQLFSALVVDDRKDPAVREKAFEKCSTTEIPQLFSALVVDDRKDPAVREKALEKCSTTEIPQLFSALPADEREQTKTQMRAFDRCEKTAGCIGALFRVLPEDARDRRELQELAILLCSSGTIDSLLHYFPSDAAWEWRRVLEASGGHRWQDFSESSLGKIAEEKFEETFDPIVVQLSVDTSWDPSGQGLLNVSCCSLTGDQIAIISFEAGTDAEEVRRRVAEQINTPAFLLRICLPGGRLLKDMGRKWTVNDLFVKD